MPPVSPEQLEAILIEVSMHFARTLERELADDARDHLQDIFARTVRKAVLMDDGEEWWEGQLGVDARAYTRHVVGKMAHEVNRGVNQSSKASVRDLEDALQETVDTVVPALERKYQGSELDLRTRVCP